jgi:hypothetical protein
MKTLPIVFLGAVACANAFGWGCEGHQIVALIASRHLTAAAHAGVYQLLKDNPVDPALSRFCQPLPTDPMLDAATWADDSKRVEKTGTWHYLDIPRGVEHADPLKYCAPVGEAKAGSGDRQDRPGCVLTGLQYELDILKDGNRSPAQRATALRYVIHFIGDMHQPLHTTSNDDDGGNCTSLTLFEDPKRGNLHAAWDYGIIAHFLKQASETPAQLAAQIDERFQSKGQGWLHDPIDFGKWILEAHQIAGKATYDKLRPKLPVAPAENGPGCAAEREKTTALKIDIDEKYAAAAMPVIELQLARAGYRLAAVLNSAI